MVVVLWFALMGLLFALFMVYTSVKLYRPDRRDHGLVMFLRGISAFIGLTTCYNLYALSIWASIFGCLLFLGVLAAGFAMENLLSSRHLTYQQWRQLKRQAHSSGA